MSYDLHFLDVHDILREGFDRSPMFNGRSKVLVLDIVLLLKIKLIVLQIREASALLNQRGILVRFMNGFSTLYLKIFNLKRCVLLWI
jgi:hypothetical protein